MTVDKKNYQDYKNEIINTRARGGEYWTNLVGLELKIAAETLGKDEANRLIRECKLGKDGWREEV